MIGSAGRPLIPLALGIVVAVGALSLSAGLVASKIGSTGRVQTEPMSPASMTAEYPTELSNLPQGVTRFIVEAVSGDLWFASITPDGSNRLYEYASQSGTLTSWPLPSDPGGGWFVGLAFDGPRHLWIAWDQTLVRFDIETKQSARYSIPGTTQFQVTDGKARWVRTITASDGSVWITREHAASLLRFDSATASFDEHGFGVPRRVTRAPDGLLWLTLARDATSHQEHTKIARFDPVLKTSIALPIPLSAISFDSDGMPVGIGPRGLTKLTGAGTIVEHRGAPHPTSAGDVIDTGDGRSVLTTRMNAVAMFDWRANEWSTVPLETASARVIGPPGYAGPRIREALAEATDVHFDETRNTVWVLLPGQSRFARFVLP